MEYSNLKIFRVKLLWTVNTGVIGHACVVGLWLVVKAGLCTVAAVRAFGKLGIARILSRFRWCWLCRFFLRFTFAPEVSAGIVIWSEGKKKIRLTFLWNFEASNMLTSWVMPFWRSLKITYFVSFITLRHNMTQWAQTYHKIANPLNINISKNQIGANWCS